MASVLNTLLVDAHKEAMSGGDPMKDFETWKTQEHGDSFEYFHGLLKHLLNVNLFVRSIREASFDLFVASLEELCPLLFALDHIHYSRWVSVSIYDLKLLKVSDPTHYEHFRKGFFAARKTDTDFSKIAYDHVHEQELVLLHFSAKKNLASFVKWRMSYLKLIPMWICLRGLA